MTIAISFKVNDAIVLAADSATTFFERAAEGRPPSVSKVFYNADKLFNLYKGLPIGMATFGAGSIGSAAIATLAKDLRRRLQGQDNLHEDWALNPSAYTMEAIADRVREFMYDEQYVKAFAAWPEKPSLGFIIAGFSSGEHLGEEWEIQIATDGSVNGPNLVRPKDGWGWSARGQPLAIVRLLIGYDVRALLQVLPNHLAPGTDIDVVIKDIREVSEIVLGEQAMPLQDAIDLALYLVEVVSGFSQFAPGAASVGGPIDVAAVTVHEGFKWVRRKHYYSPDFNPPLLSKE